MYRWLKLCIFIIAGVLVAGVLALNTGGEDRSAKSSSVEISEASIPLPRVASGDTEIPVVQSSYCWGTLGCADYVGGQAMVEGTAAVAVSPGSSIHISFDYIPVPAQVNVQQYQDNEIIEISLGDGSFVAPKESGIYYYGISAYWNSEDGKYSIGDTSSVFVIEVV